MANRKLLNLQFINDALDITILHRKKQNKSNKEEVPLKVDNETTTDEDVKAFMNRVKIALVKSLIFAGNSVFGELIGIGAISVSVPELGGLVVANPVGIFVGSAILFTGMFFFKLAMELKINGKAPT
jgi:hypothetical protein